MLNNKPIRDCPFTRFTVPILFFAPMKIRELQPSEISEAANLLSRGMNDNPIMSLRLAPTLAVGELRWRASLERRCREHLSEANWLVRLAMTQCLAFVV